MFYQIKVDKIHRNNNQQAKYLKNPPIIINILANIAKRLEEIGYPIKEEQIIPVGATVGAHIGPNACAIAYIKK